VAVYHTRQAGTALVYQISMHTSCSVRWAPVEWHVELVTSIRRGLGRVRSERPGLVSLSA